jgi:hypothetical protein
VFILVSGNLSSQGMAELFVKVLNKVEKFTKGNQAPFIAKIYKGGKVQIWRSHSELLKLVKSNG